MLKKWYFGFVQTGLWLIIAILNLRSGRSGIVVGFNIFAAVLFAVLGVIQYFCEKKGDAGKKIMNRVCIGALVLVLLVFVILLLLD